MAFKNPVNQTVCGVFLCLFFLPSSNVAASTPLQTHDLNPLTLVFGLPLISPASLPDSGQQSVSASWNISNTLNVETTATEYLFIDGETQQLNLTYQYGINAHWATRLRLSLIGHSSGELDDFIDSYHQVFGFPEGQRPNYANNNLLFQYQLNSSDQIYYNQAHQSVGDFSAELSYQLEKSIHSASSLWFGIKLPTGDSSTLSSSGATDLSLWYAFDSQLSPFWSHYYNIGLLFTGKGDILPAQQRSEVLFGSAGLELRYFKNVTLNIQLDYHSGFYDSNTDFLGDSIQISSGGHIKLDPRSRLEIVVIEDIQVGASPDVTFQFSFTHGF